MKDTVHLVVNANGVVRMTRRPPSLYRDEVSVRVTITVPDDVFRPITVPVSVDVPSDRVVQPDVTMTVDPIPEAEA